MHDPIAAARLHRLGQAPEQSVNGAKEGASSAE
jgi:hypothetical protein